MRWAFLGAGAVGGYFGSRLLMAGFDVMFVVRPGRLEQLHRHGLVVKSPLGDYAGHPPATTDPAQVQDADVIVVAVKAPHLAGALETLDRLPDVPILPLLNGIEHMDVLRSRYPGRVLGGVAHIEATLDETGAVIHPSRFARLTVGAVEPHHRPLAEALGEDLGRAGVDHRVTDDIYRALWEKYILLDVLSALTAATGLPIGRLLAEPATRLAAARLAEEVAAVARAAGVDLGDDAWPRVLAQLEAFPPTMLASMARDKAKGLPLETDHIQGGIIRAGERHGVPTPAHVAVYGVLAPYRAGAPLT
jgi:2-dehydropantoate 2-reductase